MARKIHITVFALLLLFYVQGCATVFVNAYSGPGVNLPPETCTFPPYIYGGVITEALFVANTIKGLHFDFLPHVVFVLVDLPLSFVADTVILPFTVYRQIYECTSGRRLF